MRLCIFTSLDGERIAINPEKVILIRKYENHTEIFAESDVIVNVQESVQTAMDKVIGGKHE